MIKLNITNNLRLTHQLDIGGYFKLHITGLVFRSDCEYFKMDRPIFKDGQRRILIWEKRAEHLGDSLYLAEEYTT